MGDVSRLQGYDIKDKLAREMIQKETEERTETDELLKTCITPQMYGAKGDGVTDDTTAIQEWLNNHEIRSKHIPQGTYLINGTLKISYMQEICGEHPEFVVFKQIGSGYLFNIEVGSVSLKNITLDCNNLGGGISIKDYNSDDTRIGNTHIDNCFIRNAGVNQIGILLDCANGYNYFNNVKFSGSNACVDLQIGDTYTCTCNGSRLNINYVFIRDCKFERGSSENESNALKIKYGQFIFIDSCDFCNNKSAAYPITITGDEEVDHIFIDKCLFFNNINGLYIDSKYNNSKQTKSIKIANCYIRITGTFLNVNESNLSSIYDLSVLDNVFVNPSNMEYVLKSSNIYDLLFRDNYSDNNSEYVNWFEKIITTNTCKFRELPLKLNARLSYTASSNSVTLINSTKTSGSVTFDDSTKVGTLVFTLKDILCDLALIMPIVTVRHSAGGITLKGGTFDFSKGTYTIQFEISATGDRTFNIGLI